MCDQPTSPSSEEQPVALRGEAGAGENPFAPDGALDGIVTAEVVSRAPLIWPAFVVVIVAIGAALSVSGVAIVAAAVVTGNLESLRQPGGQMKWLTEFATSPFGLCILILPGQLVFAASAGVATLFSRRRWIDQLGFRAGRIPFWTWPLFFIGTPVIGMLSSAVLTRIIKEPSEQMKMLEEMFQFDSMGSLILLLGLVSLLPGIAEELLFRGYMQRRLLARLPVAVSIVICSAFFAAAHMDVAHAAGVFPLGIWLGVIAWKADSIWPAIFGHIGNNAFAIVMASLSGPGEDVMQVDPLALPAVGLSVVSFVGCLIVLRTAGVQSPEAIS
jgi:membrane protease YdiL (CAAX protease family)